MLSFILNVSFEQIKFQQKEQDTNDRKEEQTYENEQAASHLYFV